MDPHDDIVPLTELTDTNTPAGTSKFNSRARPIEISRGKLTAMVILAMAAGAAVAYLPLKINAQSEKEKTVSELQQKFADVSGQANQLVIQNQNQIDMEFARIRSELVSDFTEGYGVVPNIVWKYYYAHLIRLSDQQPLPGDEERVRIMQDTIVGAWRTDPPSEVLELVGIDYDSLMSDVSLSWDVDFTNAFVAVSQIKAALTSERGTRQHDVIAEAVEVINLTRWNIDCVRYQAELRWRGPLTVEMVLNDEVAAFDRDFARTAQLSPDNAMRCTEEYMPTPVR